MLGQHLIQKLQQKLSPQQIQLMKLLQVPTVALEQRIKQEIEENPALEEGREEIEEELENDAPFEEEVPTEEDKYEDINLEEYFGTDDIPSYKLSVNNTSPDEEHKDIPYSAGVSFQETLITQLGLRDLNDRQYQLGEVIIGNIDEAGYLQRELLALVNDVAFSLNVHTDEQELETILAVIQDFDPAGVGARNLKECLQIQLSKKDAAEQAVQIAMRILDKCFVEFTKKHYDKIMSRLHIDEAQLKAALDEILKLNPKPGTAYAEEKRASMFSIVPDFTVTEVDGELQLTLNARNAPELKLSRAYREMLETYSHAKDKSDPKIREAALFVKQKMDAAKWFIDAVKQRQNTLYGTMSAILKYQKDFFLSGDETKIKPMILKDIADMVQLDISTISRVVNSKYVQTVYGTYLLKSFFSEALTTESGEEVSSIEVKKILTDCVENEDKRKPLTDDKLAVILKEKGYGIARRTVAKYREQLNIPVARLRKEL